MGITVEMRTQVAQLYTALFGRAPDFDGLGFWTTLLAGGKSIVEVANAMYDTAPARAYYPVFLSNAEIVGSFYENVLGRVADAQGLAFWTARLDAPGATPGSVIASMIAVVAQYTGMDSAGLLSQKLFNNKVEVAQHYAESGGDIAGATKILAGITADHATVIDAINRIDNVDPAAPVFLSAAVNGASLVMTFEDASLLDAPHAPAASAFSVTVGGVARTVSSVAVDASAKTVTLTLVSAVTPGQSVTVAYTDPTSGDDANAIQDANGNDAATLAATTVTNNTPDTTAPVFASASVNGATLVLTYTEQNLLDAVNVPFTSAFVVKVAGVDRDVDSVVVDADAKTVTLTLVSPVLVGQAVTVAYTDRSSNNDTSAIQDASGNDAAGLDATTVANTDSTAPVFASATVNGASLVMTYTEVNPLNSVNIPSASAFSVKVDGTTRTVNSVSVDANAKTVTLTLASAVTDGQAVTVAYADPTKGNDANAIQDSSGNDAASLSATAVANVDATPPVFASATANGASLVMTYTELNLLKSSKGPVAGDFSVMVEGAARAVSSVAVDANAKTVTLTLASAVANGQAVTVAYTDPTAGNDANAIQDARGNDAASLSAMAVTNNTPDTTAPEFAGATIDGASLLMTYNELNLLDAANKPAASDFTVEVDNVARTVNSVVVDAGSKTVTLTLASAVTNGQAVTVAYTDPSGIDDSNAIQDASGNDAATLVATAVTNNTPVETTPPVFASATVNGDSLVMRYTELNLLDAANAPVAGDFVVTVEGVGRAVSGLIVDANAKTVTLTLVSAVLNGDAVTIAYNDPTGANDLDAIQDINGNDAATLAATVVTNETPDITAPEFLDATVDGPTLVISYTELNLLDDTNNVAASNFVVMVQGAQVAVNTVAVDASAKTVTLTLVSAVANGDSVTVAYNDPAGDPANAIQDASGNRAATFLETAVTNNTPDSTAPEFVNASIDGATLILTYSDLNLLDASSGPVVGDFTVWVNDIARAVNSVSMGADTVTLVIEIAVVSTDVVTLDYTDPSGANDANAIQDLAGNDAISLVGVPVVNGTAVV